MAAKKDQAKKKDTTTKPKGGVVELAVVAKVTMKKADAAVIAASLVNAGLYSPADAKGVPLDKAVQELKHYYEKNTPGDELADCDNCGGMSDVRFDRCPYCGITGEDDGKQSSKDEGKEDMKDEAKGKGGESAKGEAEGGKDDKGGKLAKVATLPAGVTEDKLNEAVHEVRDLKSAVSVSYWTLGKKIGDIFEKDLWKARTDVEGAFAYKHWNQFCLTELGMTPGHATNLMDVAKKFTEKQVAEFGHTKLTLVLKAPPEDEPKLLDLAKKSSKRQLQEEVEKLKKEKNFQRDTGRGSPKQRKRDMRKAGSAKAAKKPKSLEPKITIAPILKTYTVQLFAKPEAGKEPEKRAKKIGDKPVGWVDLTDGLRCYIAVEESPTGEWRAKLRYERPAE